MTKLFRLTLLSKNASANHLESDSCKNKGLKVPCFHTLTKKGVGEGDLFASAHESPITNHGPRVTEHESPDSHAPHLFFACAPQPPDSRFSPLLGAVGASGSIDWIVVA